jgi:phospholipase/carboxylesterase
MKITKALTRLTGPETAPVFVLLHGWGSNEYDLPDLLNYCGAGSADYASLQAPIAYGMGYTWFGAWAHEGVPEGESLDKQATEAAQAIDAWVAEHIPATRPVVAMGFSQGGLLAAHLLRCNPQRYAAAVLLRLVGSGAGLWRRRAGCVEAAGVLRAWCCRRHLPESRCDGDG